MGKAFEIEYKYKKVEIHIIDFVGEVRNINGTPDLFSLSYNSNVNDKGQYILATEAEINIYEDAYFNIDELKTVGETDILIKYFEYNELVWQGFALPDFFQTGITKPRVLRIVATDRLGVLKDIANTSTATTPKAIIEECLLQTGLSLPVEIRNNNTYLETTTINRERIEGVSAYDVIRSFMVQFNSKIVQYKNKWWVVNKKLLEDGFLGQEIIDIDLVYLDGQREIKPTASEVSLFLEYGGSQRYPNNWNLNKTFYDPNRGLQFIDWTGALYSVNTSKIIGYDFIGNIQNAVLGDALTDDKSMFYRSGIHPAFGNLNALTYPHFKSEFSTVKLLADIDYKLDFRLNFTSASKIFLEAYILIKKDNNYFVYGHKGKIASAGEGTPAIRNIDPFFIRAADREGFGAVQTQWNAELDINKSTLGVLEDADGTFEAQIIIMKDRLGGTTSDILETDLFIYSAELALIDNEVESKGLIFKTKQGGDKFSKVRETETTLFSDKINQGVNGYFYNYKYDDTSITNLPKEYLLGMTRQMADMFCSARDFYSIGGKFKVNPLARYRCGDKYFVFVGGVSHRENSEIDIEEIVSNDTLIRTDYIYTYFEDSKDNIKSIGTASGSGGSGATGGGGGMTSSQLEMLTNLADWWKLDEANDAIYSEKSVYSLKGVSALGLGSEGGGGPGGDMLDSWANYTPAKANYYVPASLLVPFRNDTLSRLASLEAGGGATDIEIVVTGAGNAVTDVSLSENTLTFSKGSTFSLSTHNHDTIYKPIGYVPSWSEITNKPTTFTPSAHTHTIANVTGLQTALNGKEPSFTKNTAFNKNFGTVAGTVAEGNDSRINNGQTAFEWGNHSLAGYALNSALTAHINKDDNPHAVTKAQVGLGNVDNVKQATQSDIDTAIDNIGVVTHIDNKENPHEVTTSQIGAVDLTTNQTITGAKTFSNLITASAGISTSTLFASGIITAKEGNSTNWNKAYEDSHTHTNKAQLDVIDQELSMVSNVGFNSAYIENTIEVGGLMVNGKSFMYDDLTMVEGTIKANNVDFGNGFTIEPSGTELVFKFNGIIKQRMLSDGTILATGGITALSTE